MGVRRIVLVVILRKDETRSETYAVGFYNGVPGDAEQFMDFCRKFAAERGDLVLPEGMPVGALSGTHRLYTEFEFLAEILKGHRHE